MKNILLPELPQHQKDKLNTETQQEQQARIEKFIFQLKPQSGHRCFELNLETGIVSEVQYKTSALDFRQAAAGSFSPKRKAIYKENHLYDTALNKRNVIKKFHKKYGIPLESMS